VEDPAPTGEQKAQQGDTSDAGTRDAEATAPEGEAQDETATHQEPEARNPGPDDGESDVDAMGKPKRREVVGQGYGPSKARQLLSYVAVLALIVGAYIGAQYAISKLDVAPAQSKAQAPWAQKKAPQIAPQQFQ